MTVNRSEDISTSLFAVVVPEDDAPEQAEEHDGSVELPADKEGRHPARPSVKFTEHRQQHNREQTRGLPPNLKTSPLSSGRSGRRGK